MWMLKLVPETGPWGGLAQIIQGQMEENWRLSGTFESPNDKSTLVARGVLSKGSHEIFLIGCEPLLLSNIYWLLS